MKPCRVLVIRDYPFSGGDDDTEIANIKLALENENIEAKIVGDEIAPQMVDQIKADLIFVDYGGMSIMGSHDTALYNLRYILNWAEDHPSVPVIIWTMFTARLVEDAYEKEMSQAFKDAPANVFNLGGTFSDEEESIWRLIKTLLKRGVKRGEETLD